MRRKAGTVCPRCGMTLEFSYDLDDNDGRSVTPAAPTTADGAVLLVPCRKCKQSFARVSIPALVEKR